MKSLLIPALVLAHALAATPPAGLPAGGDYDPAITTPERFLGYAIGERHPTHAELSAYLRQLADESDRVLVVPYGRTHGHRPLFQLLISSPENIANSEALREQHLQLANPGKSHKLDLGKMPVVVNFNYSVHGNEPSGASAALVMAWYLAATKGDAIQALLDKTIILLDPCLNPDGLDRFANWTNNYVGRNPNADPNTREHNEDWPGGRTNYYFFDLNRDWMLLTQPESRGRIRRFHEWLPNFVLDFHEMSTDETYFFQPGVPERTHPLIPEEVSDLTERASLYFAAALDKTGSPYYSRERFDDFYMGKGSTIADLKGAIGILFEQASSRGRLQDSVNGPLSFADTIRNQVIVSLAVLEAAGELRQDFLEHTRGFFKGSLKEAEKADFAGYRFSSPGDPQRARLFADLLEQHAIEVETSGGGGYFVPLRQPQYRYLEALVEQRVEFEENLFYDITAWTLPLAYNLQWERLGKAPKVEANENAQGRLPAGKLGYLIDWASLNAPRLLFDLMEQDIKVRVAKQPFTLAGERFGYGTVFVPLHLQPDKAEHIHAVLELGLQELGVRITPVSSFLTSEGIDLGSPGFVPLEKPRILLVAGTGTHSYTVGSIWHLLDVLHDYPVTLVSPARLGRIDFSTYTALVLPPARAGTYDKELADRLKQWTRQGGTVVCLGSATKWAIQQELVGLSLVDTGPEEASEKEESAERRPFEKATDDRALQRIRGAIFDTLMDPTHPLAYGLGGESLPVFVEGEDFLAPSPNAYQTPLLFKPEPLLAGYASEENLTHLAGSAGVVVESTGKGAWVLFGIDPVFRAYWRGTEKLLINALLFGPLMHTANESGYAQSD